MQTKPTWKELLGRGEPLLLPCAHDALSARLIERAGFAAYSVGGYALVGARHALPDIGLVGFGEMSAGIRDIVAAAKSVEELAEIGRDFQGVPQVANMVEGGGRTPVLPPHELYRLGFGMVAYPTSLIFRVARAIETALADLKAGRPANNGAGVDFEAFKEIVSLARWADVEQRSAAARKSW